MPDLSLTQRLPARQKSVSEKVMSLQLGLGSANSRNAEQQHEVREAKRFLKENIRTDWDYPALEQYRTNGNIMRDYAEADECDSGFDRVGRTLELAGFKFHTPTNHDREEIAKEPDELEFEPLEWREREYSTGESSDEDSVTISNSTNSKKSTYKFDGPDSVGVQLSDRILARKRKRQRAIEEEVTWNDGLAHWLARRDAWCAAHTTAQVQQVESKRNESAADSTSGSAVSTPRTSTSTSDDEVLPDPRDSPATTPELTLELPKPTIVPQPPLTSPPKPMGDLFIPVAPQILQNHPVRKRITPSTYPEIYSKIIIQSRSPSVPINLLTMVRALVQGWKDDGEWPPKQAPPEKSIGRKKGSGESTLKNSVKAVGRVLRITSGESGVSPKEKG